MIFSETEDEAAISCESAVDIVDARIPAITSPAKRANKKLCSLIFCARTTIRVSALAELERLSLSIRDVSAPLCVSALPTTPRNTAIANEKTTHTEAILLESFNSEAFLIAMNLRSICGIPK